MGIESLDFKSIDVVLADINHPAFIVDTDYHIVYVNEMARLSTFNGQEVLGQSAFEVFLGLKPENSLLVRTIETRKPVIAQLCMWTSNTGDKRLSLTSVFPLFLNKQLIGAMELNEALSTLDNGLREMLMENTGKINMVIDNKSKARSDLVSPDSIIGQSQAIIHLRENIILAGKSSANLLIYGETGSGKELAAKAVHSISGSNAPFIAQNCAAIPETLLEGILFGTTKGVFTGSEANPGLFELADNGTLFLDELNSMSPNLQAKLLRVIQDKKVRRLGGQREIAINVRLIAAINTRPGELISNGSMREDLFYRLGVLYLNMPTLRERREDIPLLLIYFLNEFNQGRKTKMVGFDKQCMDFFMTYQWPGNVRELRNMVERAVNLSTEKVFKFNLGQLFPYSTSDRFYGQLHEEKQNAPCLPPRMSGAQTLKEAVAAAEEAAIRQALAANNGNIAKASRALDIPQQTMNNKMDRYQLRPFAKKIKARRANT